MPADLLTNLKSHGLVSCTEDSSQTGCGDCLMILGEHLRKAVRIINAEQFFIEDISCLQVNEGLQLIYHFDHFQYPGRICLRILVSPQKPCADSIADIYPGAQWHERECTDFFGITFRGNPNPVPLLLSPEIPGPVLLKTEKQKKDLVSLLPRNLKFKKPDREAGIDHHLAEWAAGLGKGGNTR
ncbi:MAG: NADH-quinone oxidoreductase subunit C [Thermodesulfobacteriota bacterium]